MYLTMLVLPVEEGPYTNNGGVPAALIAVVSRLICDSLPSQRFDNTDKLMQMTGCCTPCRSAVRTPLSSARGLICTHRTHLKFYTTQTHIQLCSVRPRLCSLLVVLIISSNFEGTLELLCQPSRYKRHSMCGQDCLIDLTGPSTPGKWKRKTRSTTVADTIDLSGSPNTVAHVVDLGRRQQADGAGPSTTERPAKMVGMVEAESPNAAADSETEESKSSGKRKRCWATDRAKQAEAKKQQLKAQRAEASALKAEAKAAKKAAEQKRVDPFGKIVRYASKPSEKTKERMARAMPSKFAYHHC